MTKEERKIWLSEGEFLGDGEPIGAIITMDNDNTLRKVMANDYFNRKMFVYFHELSADYCGWGISYINWLSSEGWKHLGFDTFERISIIKE